MAEEKPQEEKTEQPTPKRLEDARKKGQIARSKELNMAAVLIAAAITLGALQSQFGEAFSGIIRHGLTIEPAMAKDPAMMTQALSQAAFRTLGAFAPLLMALMVAAILGGVAIGGWAVSAKPMAPNFGKLNPLKGIKKIFGVRGLVEVVKALAKAFVVGGVGLMFLIYSGTTLINLSRMPISSAINTAGSLVTTVFLLTSFSLILVAAIDVPFQIWNHKKQLKMTRKEVQDELKETDGRPEVKSKIRAIQQETANRRMLKDVPDADVIVTNPTHFAVALKYAEDGNLAPTVLAKGVDLMAEQIRNIGKENRIMLFEAPLLARALYWTTDVGAEIPDRLYLAVAKVLTYVYRLRAAETSINIPWPEKPALEVDTELAAGPRTKKPGKQKPNMRRINE